MSLGLAFRCFFKALGDKEFATKAKEILDGKAAPAALPQPPAAAEPAKAPAPPPGEALKLLAVLQRDGRLLDFLAEDLADYEDAQVGAAVRNIHRDCKAALAKYVDLAPVIDREEGSQTDVPANFDPTQIRVTGNVKGHPPFKGSLAHRGWKASSFRVPAADPGAAMILAPAEVELA
jgi:hypothetical protein